MKKIKDICKFLFEGDMQISKTDFWLTLLSGTLLGVIIGIFCAPMTHGVSVEIGSHNGNTNDDGCCCDCDDDCDCDCECDCECVGVVE